jgi:subtilisin
MKKVAFLLILCIAFVMLTSVSFVSADSSKARVIVGFKAGPDAAIIKALGGEIIDQSNALSTIVSNLPSQAVQALKNNPKIAYVEEDAIMTTLDYTVNSELANSWGVERIGGGIVQAYGNSGEGVKVAVIDTGISYSHTELAANLAHYDNYDGTITVIGFNAITGTNNADDDNGHGSHCAGIIAAIKGDGMGPETLDDRIVGVAPQASLYPVKVLDSTGSGYISDIAEGIQWAVDQGVDVISLSLGGPSGSTALQTAIQNAYQSNIVVVAAAGNNGQARVGSSVGYPAKYPTVIAVAATDSNNIRAYFSSTGPEVDISAPGVGIISSILNDNTYYMQGTSMACPHVAGAAALLIKNNPALTAAEVTNILTSTADDLGSNGKDSLYGYGLVDIDEAIDLATVSTTNQPQTVTASKGTATSDLSTLASNDDSYMILKPIKSVPSYLLDVSFKINVPQEQSQVESITIDNIIKYSSTVTQTLYIYDYTTKTWTLMNTNSIGSTEQSPTFTTSNAARYVSPNGDIAARIYVSAKSAFTGSLDVFSFTVNYIQ